jgi:hypothetical protein
MSENVRVFLPRSSFILEKTECSRQAPSLTISHLNDHKLTTKMSRGKVMRCNSFYDGDVPKIKTLIV